MRALNMWAVIVMCTGVVLSQQSASGSFLVEGGKAQGSIVRPSEARPAEEFAALELRSHIARMCNVIVPIVSDDRLVEGPRIIIGGPQVNRTAAEVVSATEFRTLNPGPDGVLVKSFGSDTLLLAGSDDSDPTASGRATLYAVYMFLEQLGCSWPGIGLAGESIPAIDTIDLVGFDITSKPAVSRRGFITSLSRHDDDFVLLLDWMGKQRLNSLLMLANLTDDYIERFGFEMDKRGITVESGHHSAFFWIPPYGNEYWPERYFETHPEYFALVDGARKCGARHRHGGRERWIDGQPCLTEPGVVDVAVAHIREFADLHPQIRVIGFWMQDGAQGGQGWCECERCTAVDAKDASKSRTYIRFLGQVAERLKETHPHLMLSGLAYQRTYSTPEDVGPLPDNLIITLAPYHDYAHDFSDSTSRINAKQWGGVLAWGKTVPNVQLYEYYMGVFGNYHRVFPMYYSFPGDFRAYRDNGIVGVHTQGEAQNFWMYQLNYYLMAKYLWNPNREIEDVLKQFCVENFGEAAAEDMHAFYRLLGTRMREIPEYRCNGVPQKNFLRLFDSDTRAKCREFLKTAEGKVSGDARMRWRMAEAGFHYTDLIVEQDALYDKAVSAFDAADYDEALQLLAQSDSVLADIERHRDEWRGLCLFHLSWAVWDTGKPRERNEELRSKIPARK